jgi:hypothetical protein
VRGCPARSRRSVGRSRLGIPWWRQHASRLPRREQGRIGRLGICLSSQRLDADSEHDNDHGETDHEVTSEVAMFHSVQHRMAQRAPRSASLAIRAVFLSVPHAGSCFAQRSRSFLRRRSRTRSRRRRQCLRHCSRSWRHSRRSLHSIAARCRVGNCVSGLRGWRRGGRGSQSCSRGSGRDRSRIRGLGICIGQRLGRDRTGKHQKYSRNSDHGLPRT